MTRVRCVCGRVMYQHSGSCPSCGRPLAMAQPTNDEIPSAPGHDWSMHQEYDDCFFTCKLCGLRVSQRKGIPPTDALECERENIKACRSGA